MTKGVCWGSMHEHLERRIFLAAKAFALADYFPVGKGLTWEYEGISLSDNVRYVRTAAPDGSGGFTVHDDVSHDHGGYLALDVTDATYKLDVSGLTLLRLTHQVKLDYNDITFQKPVPWLPAIVHDGDAVRWSNVPVMGQYTNIGDGNISLKGSDSGTAAVHVVNKPNLLGGVLGSGYLETLQISIDHTITWSGESDGKPY